MPIPFYHGDQSELLIPINFNINNLIKKRGLIIVQYVFQLLYPVKVMFFLKW